METEIDPPTLKDHVLHVLLVILTVVVIWSLITGCGPIPVEVCMEHPRYGQVCVTMVNGQVVKVSAVAGNVDDEDGLKAWAQERVK